MIATVLHYIGGLIAADAWVASFWFPAMLVYLAVKNDAEPERG